MDAPDLKVKILIPGTPTPSRAHPTDSGFDLCAMKFEKLYYVQDDAEVAPSLDDVDELMLLPGQRALVHSGISATVGAGWELQIRPRSGLALKQGLTVLNTPGTIDEEYRGPICVILVNLSNVPQIIKKGDRIAQMVMSPVGLGGVQIVDDLNTTTRNAGGFGSTGV